MECLPTFMSESKKSKLDYRDIFPRDSPTMLSLFLGGEEGRWIVPPENKISVFHWQILIIKTKTTLRTEYICSVLPSSTHSPPLRCG